MKTVRDFLAWVAVALAIPMAGFSLWQSWSSAKWEAEDMRWEREDVERHTAIIGKLNTLLGRCR